MSKLTDTSPEADRVLTEVYRKMPIGQKWRQLGEMYQLARTLHAAGVRLRNPTATFHDIHEAWLTVNLGFTHLREIQEPSMNPSVPNLRNTQEVIDVLGKLKIPYALGGSIASSLHGIDRYTRDADITVEPFSGKENQFANAFGPEYYVSLSAIQEAIRNRSSFNLINTSTGFKIDIFVRKDDPFEQSAMRRRVTLELPERPSQPIFLHSPEDIVLFKLKWFRLGDETSEQQLRDVIGVLKVQAGKLDDAYLDHWANELGVSDLLTRVRQEV